MHGRKISVVGLGYVGLPVAIAFGKQGRTIGFDINEARLAELREGHDRTREVAGEDLALADIQFTSEIAELTSADFHIVAVPTPVDDAHQPDLTPVVKASETVGRALKRGDIVVYESTVYPGVTEDERRLITEMMAKGTYAMLTLASRDLDATFDKLQAADVDIVQEPIDQPYGIRDCAIRDPFGNLIRINQVPA